MCVQGFKKINSFLPEMNYTYRKKILSKDRNIESRTTRSLEKLLKKCESVRVGPSATTVTSVAPVEGINGTRSELWVQSFGLGHGELPWNN